MNAFVLKCVEVGPSGMAEVVIVGIPVLHRLELRRGRDRFVQSLGIVQDALELFLEHRVRVGGEVEVGSGVNHASDACKHVERHGDEL